MPRIRRANKRIRGANGGRTRNEDCCCGSIPCSEWLDSGIRPTIEFSAEVVGLTIGTTTGCTCSNVPLSGILTYGACAITPTQWCISQSVGCNKCGGGPAACCARLGLAVACSGDIITVSAGLAMVICDQFASVTGSWQTLWEESFPVSSFNEGEEYVLPYLSSSTQSSPVCDSSGDATSELRVVWTQ